MGTVLDRRYTARDSDAEIIGAIFKLSTDKLYRIVISDECDWLQEKMTEIARLTRILKKRSKKTAKRKK